MNVIKELIGDTPQNELKDYECYLHTHLKLLMTGINKAKIQDTTQVQIRKNQCIEKCYKKNMQGDPSSIHDTIEQIRQCKQKCGEQKKAVKKYLDDINYYSSLKFSNCSKSCIGDEYSQEYNSCIWNCFNKLDRRYKKYWMEQRAKIQQRFVPT